MHRIIKFVFALTIICLLLTSAAARARARGGSRGSAKGARAGKSRASGGGSSYGGASGGGSSYGVGYGGSSYGVGNGYTTGYIIGSNRARQERNESSGPSIQLGLWHYFTVAYFTYYAFPLN